MTTRLNRLIGGKLERPPRVLLYGLDGIGKSTFAADAPSPVFIGSEDGTSELDVQRMPDIGKWEDVSDSLDELTSSDHPFKTVIIDTLDWLEPLCFGMVCRAANKPDIEAIPYGKGYVAALDHWRAFLSRLDKLRTGKGMGVVLLAHAQVKTFRNPAGEDFDHYEMKMNPKAASLLREWADAVLFANYETYVHKDDKGRVRGLGDGSRVMHTEYRPAWDAKNRFGLPAQMPLSWREFEDGIRANVPEEPTVVTERINALIEAADEKVRVQAKEALTRAAGDPKKLAKLADWLRGKTQKAA